MSDDKQKRAGMELNINLDRKAQIAKEKALREERKWILQPIISRHHKDIRRIARRPLFYETLYRGKRQWIVGYTWSALGSHHLTGRVYECILGHGATFEEAIDAARKKVAKLDIIEGNLK